VKQFVASLPDRYRELFNYAAAEVHARIAHARGDTLANVGWFLSDRAGDALCVVADDRSGLLATIAAAFVLCGLDVIDAEAFTRQTSGARQEAVDLFWVRNVSTDAQSKVGRLADHDVARIRETLIGLLQGDIRPPTPASVIPKAEIPELAAVVRFKESADGAFATLEVEAGDRPGLLLALSRSLYENRVQIVSCEAKSSSGRVQDRFSVVEQDGSAISPTRRLELQVAVLTAVEKAMGRGARTGAN
jgi:[protein-PII] uridylyltransferase